MRSRLLGIILAALTVIAVCVAPATALAGTVSVEKIEGKPVQEGEFLYLDQGHWNFSFPGGVNLTCNEMNGSVQVAENGADPFTATGLSASVGFSGSDCPLTPTPYSVKFGELHASLSLFSDGTGEMPFEVEFVQFGHHCTMNDTIPLTWSQSGTVSMVPTAISVTGEECSTEFSLASGGFTLLSDWQVPVEIFATP